MVQTIIGNKIIKINLSFMDDDFSVFAKKYQD